MTVSKDRVRFFLPPRYFSLSQAPGRHFSPGSSGMSRETCVDILKRVFHMDSAESHMMMHHNPTGFTIICRPSQFARFIVLRHTAGECINGIRDLVPELVDPSAVDPYRCVADKSGVSLDDVRCVLNAVGFTGEHQLLVQRDRVNVSGRHGRVA